MGSPVVFRRYAATTFGTQTSFLSFFTISGSSRKTVCRNLAASSRCRVRNCVLSSMPVFHSLHWRSPVERPGFRSQIVYKLVVQVATAWSRSGPYQNHGCRVTPDEPLAAIEQLIRAPQRWTDSAANGSWRRASSGKRFGAATATGEPMGEIARSSNVSHGTISRLTA